MSQGSRTADPIPPFRGLSSDRGWSAGARRPSHLQDGVGHRTWSLRCTNLLIVRSPGARDVAALLDFDPGVASYVCRAAAGPTRSNRFEVTGTDGKRWMLDDEDECFLDLWGEVRRRNCRWLLSARPRPLSRQVLVDASTSLGLEEACTVGSVLSGLGVIGGLGALAFLVSSGVAVVDLDDNPISPDTPVRAGRPPFNLPPSGRAQ